jgi:ABC-type lipoprotein release transport system permease subunit
MRAIGLRLRTELRSRWRAWLGLALVLGLVGGVVLAAAAGARRTDTAYERFLRDQRAFDAVVLGTCTPGESPEETAVPQECNEGEAATLAPVRESAPVLALNAAVTTMDGRSVEPGGDPEYTGPGEVSVLGSPKGRYGTRINRPRVVDGRLPHPGAADEVAISQPLAERVGIDVGDRLRMTAYPNQQSDEGGAVRRTVRVVGTELAPFELAPPSGLYFSTVLVTPALLDELAAEGVQPSGGLLVRLHRGDQGIPALRAAIERAGINAMVGFRQADQAKAVVRATQPHVVGLWLLAGLAGLAAVAVFGTALARQTWAESDEYTTLLALGFSPRQLVALSTVRALLVGALAALVAVPAAVALSPLTPVGLAREAEPDAGLAFDPLVLGLGALAIVTLAALLVLWPAIRLARAAGSADDRVPARPSAAADAATSIGLPAPATIGVRMALEPSSGQGDAPVRSGLLGVTAAMLALAVAVTFGVSVAHLLETPRLIGFNWDATVLVHEGTTLQRGDIRRRVSALDGVDGATLGTVFLAEGVLLGPDKTSVEVLGLGPGRVGPAVIDGRAPVAADEILLGSETLDELGVQVGDRVGVSTTFVEFGGESQGGTSGRFEIVGRGVIPPFQSGSVNESRLGRGAVLTIAGVQSLVPQLKANAVYVRFEPDAERAEVVARLRDLVPVDEADGVFAVQRRRSGVLDIEEVSDLPLLLGGLVALMAAGVLAHVMVTSVRVRRRDLAVLRALGFRRRQLRVAVLSQATTISAIALLVALPLGVMLGRVAWRLYADSIGVVPEPTIGAFVVVVLVVGTLVAANLIALWPARTAARARPAVVLRSE